jgi:hypothetical protein
MPIKTKPTMPIRISVPHPYCFGFFFIGAPHFGQDSAFFETSFPHSLHFVNAMLSPFSANVHIPLKLGHQFRFKLGQ